jgi:hypothetical protein
VLDIVAHKNVWLWAVTVSDILDSYHLLVVSPEQEIHHNCGLFRKPVHISWPAWRKPWATGGD